MQVWRNNDGPITQCRQDLTEPRSPVLADRLSVRPDRSVWSHRYGRVVQHASRARELTDICGLLSKPVSRCQQARVSRTLLIGFDAGFQLLASLQTDSPRAHITLCEPFPPTRASLCEAWTALGINGPITNQIIAQWPALTTGLHRIRLQGLPETDRIFQYATELTLVFGQAQHFLHELTGPFDSILFGSTLGGLPVHPGAGFGAGQLRRLSHARTRMAGPGGSDDLPSLLRSQGADVTGTGSGWFGQWRRHHRSIDSAVPVRQNAVILGAGIAGLTVARELAGNGIEVTLLEAGKQLLAGGSAQPALAGHLHFSIDDNPLARLTRAAQALQSRLDLSTAIGRLQLLPDAAGVAAAHETIKRIGLPADLVRVVGAAQASELAGLRIGCGAMWQPSTRMLTPQLLAADLPARINLRTGVTVRQMLREGPDWVLIDQHGRPVATAPTVVFCTGSVPQFCVGRTTVRHSHPVTARSVQTSLVAGQTTRLYDSFSGRLRCILGARSYACPMPDGSVLTGASYRPSPTEVSRPPAGCQPADQQANISGWLELTRSARASTGSGTEALRVLNNYVGERHTTADHLPLIGPLADEQAAHENWAALHRDDRLAIPMMPGIFMAGGFGSRGSLWSALAATVLSDLLCGAQPPIERSLIAAIAPQRFLRKSIRRYGAPDACTMAAVADSLNEGPALRTPHD